MGDDTAFSVQTISTGEGGGAAALVLSGDLDVYAAELLMRAVDGIAPEAAGIDLDMSKVSFVDSSGLRALLKTNDHLGPDGSSRIFHPQPALLRLLELTGLLEHFALID